MPSFQYSPYTLLSPLVSQYSLHCPIFWLEGQCESDNTHSSPPLPPSLQFSSENSKIHAIEQELTYGNFQTSKHPIRAKRRWDDCQGSQIVFFCSWAASASEEHSSLAEHSYTSSSVSSHPHPPLPPLYLAPLHSSPLSFLSLSFACKCVSPLPFPFLPFPFLSFFILFSFISFSSLYNYMFVFSL